jgi:Helix-turn-helix domain
MSQPELTRLEVIQRIKQKTLRQRQAAELLSLSVRQVKRLCKAYQAFGPRALISKRRGQASNNRLHPSLFLVAFGMLAKPLIQFLFAWFSPELISQTLVQILVFRPGNARKFGV